MKKTFATVALLFGLPLSVLGISSVYALDAAPTLVILGCEAVGDLKPICEFQAPEDIELIPGTKTLIVSQFGGIAESGISRAGSLAAYNTETAVKSELFPLNVVAGVGNWGEKKCKFPGSEFSPHGIHLSKRDSGRMQLLVVNHGGRESVEFFEVLMEAGAPSLSWRGCVELPKPAYLNDVVALPELGFVVSHMFNKDSAGSRKAAMSGKGSGFVYQWYPRLGVQAVPNTYGAMPNGLQISKDGQYIFINMYTGGGIRKVELATGKVAGRAFMRRPDNSSWLPDGRLLVASHVGNTLKATECFGLLSGACGLAFKLIAVDPNTMQQEVVFEHEGAPMGAATVATVVDGVLYMGSYAGNRLLTAPWNN